MNMRMKALAAAGALVLVGGAGYGVGVAQGYQPNMQNALRDLYQARTELTRATPDKGGHRVAAINLVNQAINQTQAGIRAADYNNHGWRHR